MDDGMQWTNGGKGKVRTRDGYRDRDQESVMHMNRDTETDCRREGGSGRGRGMNRVWNNGKRRKCRRKEECKYCGWTGTGKLVFMRHREEKRMEIKEEYYCLLKKREMNKNDHV